MKCLYCGGEMEKTKSTYTVDRKRYLLFIREVPTYICTKCREKYFEEVEVEAVQNMIKTLETEITKVRTAV